MSASDERPANSFALVTTSDPRPVHFIGIAGAGMSALAELFVRRGAMVQGTDSNADGAPDLSALGVTVSAHNAAMVSGARAVVYSSAIPKTHPEMVAAQALHIPVVRRAEALAEAVTGGVLVAIAGTHGKTTTTVMTTEALAFAGRNPTGIVGGRVGLWNGNLRVGGNETFVVEADEYDRSFLALQPTVAVALNVEADHLDIYADLADIKSAFEKFIAPARYLVRSADDAGAMSLDVGAAHEVIAYSATMPGTEPAADAAGARLVAHDTVLDEHGARFAVAFDGEMLGDVILAVPGLHNVRNALAALASGLALGCEFHALAAGLATFRGVERRFQRLGNAGNVEVIDDYAHHPTEISATIAAARFAFPERNLVVAFQPHLYSRTADLHREFARALDAADAVFLCDIYGAREEPVRGVTSALIGQLISPDKLKWSGARSDLAASLQRLLASGDVLITMGAGDITRTGSEVLSLLRS